MSRSIHTPLPKQETQLLIFDITLESYPLFQQHSTSSHFVTTFSGLLPRLLSQSRRGNRRSSLYTSVEWHESALDTLGTRCWGIGYGA